MMHWDGQELDEISTVGHMLVFHILVQYHCLKHGRTEGWDWMCQPHSPENPAYLCYYHYPVNPVNHQAYQ